MTNRDKVYKYRNVSDRNITMLSANKLWASKAEKLNDVFERFLANEATQELKNYIEDKYGKIESRKQISDDHDFQAVKYLSEVKESAVFSMSYNKHQKLLWSLYAESMHGFVIEFDKNKLLEVEHVDNFDVEYTETPKANFASQDASPLEKIKFFYSQKNLLGKKTKDWEQEEEFRIVFAKEGGKEYPNDAVTAIYFGYQMDADTMRLITKIMPNTVKFYEVFPEINSSGGFVFKDRPLNPQSLLFGVKVPLA